MPGEVRPRSGRFPPKQRRHVALDGPARSATIDLPFRRVTLSNENTPGMIRRRSAIREAPHATPVQPYAPAWGYSSSSPAGALVMRLRRPWRSHDSRAGQCHARMRRSSLRRIRRPSRASLESDPSVWRALPREVSDWWRRGAGSRLEQTEAGWTIRGAAMPDGSIQFARTGEPALVTDDAGPQGAGGDREESSADLDLIGAQRQRRQSRTSNVMSMALLKRRLRVAVAVSMVQPGAAESFMPGGATTSMRRLGARTSTWGSAVSR
jgi:hypothetical protein